MPPGSRKGTQIKGYHEILLPLIEPLAAQRIEFDFARVQSEIPSLCRSTEEMIDWYNSGTVLICTSSSEGTPNPALEAAACGCTLVSTAVGNMPELIRDGVNGRLVARSVPAVLAGIREALANYPAWGTAMQADIAGWSWETRARQYFDLFRRLIDERRAS